MSDKKRIAVVGGGATGIAAALELMPWADVQLFERDGRLGGHALSIPVTGSDGRVHDVDVGFMVFNRARYPTLMRVFEQLGAVDVGHSEMSFSYYDTASGQSYVLNLDDGSPARAASSLLTPYLGEVLRFMALGERDALGGELSWDVPLRDYLDRRRVSQALRELYILPMGAALWSVPEGEVLDFSARRYLRFCLNHGLLQRAEKFQWCHVSGGSSHYVEAAQRALGTHAHVGHAVTAITRQAGGVLLRFEHGAAQHFDAVVMATHGDITRRLLADADAQEEAALTAIRYQPHQAALHRDASMMPRVRDHWASWNVARLAHGLRITYHLNPLQALPVELGDLFVTLDPPATLPAEAVVAHLKFEHPVLDVASALAVPEVAALQGHRHTFYAGAWLGDGFHEDAMRSGAAAAASVLAGLSRRSASHA